MIFDASISFASTSRSVAEKLERSAPISVGANRAAMRWSVRVSGTEASWARATMAQMIAASANTQSFLAFAKLRAAVSMHATRRLQRRRVGTQTTNGGLPHAIGWRREDQFAVDVANQPGR